MKQTVTIQKPILCEKLQIVNGRIVSELIVIGYKTITLEVTK